MLIVPPNELTFNLETHAAPIGPSQEASVSADMKLMIGLQHLKVLTHLPPRARDKRSGKAALTVTAQARCREDMNFFRKPCPFVWAPGYSYSYKATYPTVTRSYLTLPDSVARSESIFSTATQLTVSQNRGVSSPWTAPLSYRTFCVACIPISQIRGH